MSRAALLPTPGDPWLLRYWLANFVSWGSCVDELRLLVNGQNDPDARTAIFDMVDIAARSCAQLVRFDVQFLPEMTDHGVLLEQLVADTDCDTLLLCEDDAYVRRPGQIEVLFARIERGDAEVIGSPRGSASQNLIDRGWELWPGSEKTNSHDEGTGLWPAFLFAKKSTLERTDRRYGAQNWFDGETVPGLDVVAAEHLSADTFVSTGWQLRALDARIEHMPQYRACDPAFIPGYLAQNPPWFHIGSLSSGYGQAFANDTGNRRAVDLGVTTAPQEWSRRVYWWERAWLNAGELAHRLPEQHARYRAGLDELMAVTGGRVTVDAWHRIFDGWVNWNEAAL